MSGREVRFVISVDPSYELNDVNFVLSLSGPMSREAGFGPAGRVQPNGCHPSVFIIAADRESCTEHPMPLYGYAMNSIDLDKSVAVRGRIVRELSSRAMFGQVLLYLDDTELVTSSGKRTYFNLPEVGMTPYPQGLGLLNPSIRQAPLDYGIGIPVYAPGSLPIAYDFNRELTPAEKVETVSPEPNTPGDLSWVTADDLHVRPFGGIVDTTKEDSSQSVLFVLGILAGLVGGFVPLIAKYCRRSWQSSRKAPRPSPSGLVG